MQSTKAVNPELLKAVTEQGTFEGLLSPYGVVDLGKDLVEPGSFTKNLREAGLERPLLWQHETHSPIGTLRLEDRPQGLWAKGSLVLSVPQAKAAYDLIKAGAVTGLSIGFQAVRETFEDGVRHLKEIRLFEGSVVTLPMAEAARIVTVKNINHSQIEIALKSFRDDILRELRKTV